MKRKTQVSSLMLFGGLLLGSCTDNSAPAPATEATDTTTIAVVSTLSNPHDLLLIDNQKWVIDTGMRVSIDSIDWRLQAFSGTSLEAYKTLSTDLAHHTKTIISSCTMKGQAHDELHKWLLPFIDLRKELDSITTPAQGQAITEELTNEIIIFKTFFE